MPIQRAPWQNRIQRIIFETDTPAGKTFDILLLIAIVCSFFVITFYTVKEIRERYGDLLYAIEWFFTIIFTLEYIVRIISVENKRKYIFSFYGLIDLLSILPTYLSLFLVESQLLAILRTVRLVRVFKVLELPQYTKNTKIIIEALQASRPKITVFLTAVFTIVIVVGTIMYVVEGEESGFTSIPRSIYWTIVTITTVGYGDIAPQTVLGQTIASVIMLLGYAIIAVPTGIVSGEILRGKNTDKTGLPTTDELTCPACRTMPHPSDALYCRRCGSPLKPTHFSQ